MTYATTSPLLQELLAAGVVRFNADNTGLILPSGSIFPIPAADWNTLVNKPAIIAAGATTTVAKAALGISTGAPVANATDAASVITQLNALLASLRTAGIIAV